MKDRYNILLTLMGLEIGGAETHVVELAIGLKRQGFNIIIASNGGVYEKELLENDIKHYHVPLQNKNVKNMINAYYALKKIIRYENIDLVHAHARIPAFICGLLHKKMGFPFITTAHWVFNTAWGLKYITNWGQQTISVSEDIKKYLIKNYKMDEKNIKVTINGIDTEKFSPNIDVDDIIKEFELTGKNHIVYVSRLDSDRSEVAFQLVEIVPALSEKIQDLEVIIVGNGNVFNQLKRKADAVNKKLGRRVIVMTGGRTDINKFVALSNLFIGVSRSALEAMAASKPVIVAGNEGYIGIFDETKLFDAIDSNFTCRGLKMPHSNDLKRDILTVMTEMDDTQRSKIGSFGKKIIEERYSINKMVQDNIEVYMNTLSKPSENMKYDVMISGYYGFKNSGDDALLRAIIDNLRIFKQDIKITVLSMNPRETQRVYGVDAINRINIFKIWWTMKKTRLLINGGGSLIQDITSTKSLLYYLAVIRLAKKMGLKVMVYANGFGPVNRQRNRELTKQIINQVDVITLREEVSKKELEQLGITIPPIHVTADPAVTLSAATEEVIDNVFRKEGIDISVPLVGFSVRTWEGDEKYSEVIARTADYMIEQYGVHPVFIPMHYPRDLHITHNIISKMKGKGYAINNKYSVDETLGIIKRMDMLIGMRLHALIYAASFGVPVIGLVYEPKVEGFLKYIHQRSAGYVDQLEFEQLKNLIDDTWNRREEIKEELQNVTIELKEKAISNAKIAVELIEM